MVDFDCKTEMIKSPNLPTSKSSIKLSSKLHVPSPAEQSRPAGHLSQASDSACAAYENYLRLPELRRLWMFDEFPGWNNEPVLKPALQALEITFRFISVVLSDSRPYTNRREWIRRLEALARDQVEIVAQICEDEAENGESATAPIFDLSSSFGVLARNSSSSAEVWRLSGESPTTVVSHVSEASLLPRLAAWEKSESIATTIFYSIESAMRRCPYTLGLGEPNLAGKPSLHYDAVCRPAELHEIHHSTSDIQENQYLFSIHQILESWIQAASKALDRVESNIKSKEFANAATNCWILERIWRLLEEIERLHLLMDPDDFLRLKTQLRIRSGSDSDSFCFRSKGLVEIAKRSKDLKHKVPAILEVEVDPMGGPVVQEAAMRLYREKGSFEKVHVLQAMQAVESAEKRFFFGYKQVLVAAVGSVETQGNCRAVTTAAAVEDAVARVFMEPTYYPSLDAAKTFLGGFWEREAERSRRR